MTQTRQNIATVYTAKTIAIENPKGSMSGWSWVGHELRHTTGSKLRFNAEVTAAFDAACEGAHAGEVEYKLGYEIHDGNRDGWEWTGETIDDAHGLYVRTIRNASEPVVVAFGREDLA